MRPLAGAARAERKSLFASVRNGHILHGGLGTQPGACLCTDSCTHRDGLDVTLDSALSDATVSSSAVSVPRSTLRSHWNSSGRWSEPWTNPRPQPDADRSTTVDGSERSDGADEVLPDYENLQRKLETMPVIEQAKGILIGRFGIDPDTAFGLLRRWSCNTNRKLRDICRLLVDTAARPDDAGATSSGPAALDLLIANLNMGAGAAGNPRRRNGSHR